MNVLAQKARFGLVAAQYGDFMAFGGQGRNDDRCVSFRATNQAPSVDSEKDLQGDKPELAADGE